MYINKIFPREERCIPNSVPFFYDIAQYIEEKDPKMFERIKNIHILFGYNIMRSANTTEEHKIKFYGYMRIIQKAIKHLKNRPFSQKQEEALLALQEEFQAILSYVNKFLPKEKRSIPSSITNVHKFFYDIAEDIQKNNPELYQIVKDIPVLKTATRQIQNKNNKKKQAVLKPKKEQTKQKTKALQNKRKKKPLRSTPSRSPINRPMGRFVRG